MNYIDTHTHIYIYTQIYEASYLPMDICVRMKSRTAFSILHRFPGWWASAVMPLPLPSQIGRRSKWRPVKLVF